MFAAHYWHTHHPTEQVIYDVDDNNALIHPAEAVLHADAASPDGSRRPCRFSGDPSSIVHDPYGCFGAPGVAWPRGYPLSKVRSQNANTCELAASREGVATQRIGVVQALANHDPDTDAIYRLTSAPGGLPFDFTATPLGAPECRLVDIPAEAMAPHNAQVSVKLNLL